MAVAAAPILRGLRGTCIWYALPMSIPCSLLRLVRFAYILGKKRSDLQRGKASWQVLMMTLALQSEFLH
jgi:hypothetical protein